MNFRFIHVLIGSAFGAAFLGAACTYQPPTASTTGGEAGMGLGGAGGGSAGMGGSPGTGGGGMAGMGGTASAGGQGGAGGGPITKWWNDAWQNRVKISFQNGGGEQLTNFPVMVRLDEMRASGIMSSTTGADLRFFDPDGTSLPYEIDGWNGNGGSFVWVNVPTIDPTDTDYVWLYYGNAGASAEQKSSAVWNSFTVVYHMSPGAVAPQFPSSVGMMNPGSWVKTAGYAVAGPINLATRFNGVGYVHIGENSVVAVNPNESRTIEAWVQPTGQQDQHLVWQEGQCVGWHLSTTSTDTFWGHLITAPNKDDLCANAVEVPVNALLMPKVWQYVTLVLDRPNKAMALFVNGTKLVEKPIDNTGFTDGNGEFEIGADYDGNQAFLGDMDEVRVSVGARSPKWIAAQHKSMTDAFLVFSPVETP